MLSTRKIIVAATTVAFLAVGVCISFLLFGFCGNISLSNTRGAIEGRSEAAVRVQPPYESPIPVSDPEKLTPFAGEIALATGTIEDDLARPIPELIESIESEIPPSDENENELAHSDDAKSADASDAMIDDIEAIRRQVGITAFSEGTNPGGNTSNADPVFRQALESIVENDAGKEIIPHHVGDPIEMPHPSDAVNLTPNTIAAQTESLPLSAAEEHDSIVALVRSLQYSVDQLSRRADDLEKANEYEAADRLRRLAKKLRKEIRLHRSAK